MKQKSRLVRMKKDEVLYLALQANKLQADAKTSTKMTQI